MIENITTLFIWVIWVLLTYYFQKSREQEMQWRKQRLKAYIDLIEWINCILWKDWASEDNRRKYNNSFNTMYLLASPSVLSALKNYNDLIHIKDRNENFMQIHNEKLKGLIVEIRKDIKIEWKLNKEFETVLMWLN